MRDRKATNNILAYFLIIETLWCVYRQLIFSAGTATIAVQLLEFQCEERVSPIRAQWHQFSIKKFVLCSRLVPKRRDTRGKINVALGVVGGWCAESSSSSESGSFLLLVIPLRAAPTSTLIAAAAAMRGSSSARSSAPAIDRTEQTLFFCQRP